MLYNKKKVYNKDMKDETFMSVSDENFINSISQIISFSIYFPENIYIAFLIHG